MTDKGFKSVNCTTHTPPQPDTHTDTHKEKPRTGGVTSEFVTSKHLKDSGEKNKCHAYLDSFQKQMR